MHSSSLRRRALVLAAAFVLPLAVPIAARADGDVAVADGGVARISFLQGPVSVQRGDSASPVDAALNAPVLGADYITTGQGGRAEVEFDGRTAIRLGEDVQMRFAHLDQDDREVQLAQGTIDLRVAGDVDPRTDVDTPSVTIHAVEPGSYRISVDNDGSTFVTARSGRAEVVSPHGTEPLGPGRTLVASGTAANPRIENVEAVALDDFDAFCQDRDARFDRALASNEPYVNPSVQGLDDVDADGRWVDDSSYGNVWIPNDVPQNWAPYQDGSWTWEGGYGYTWVGSEPWGWAPYHYGRWYYSDAYRHWAWYPPPRAGFAVWSPALVAFFGFGGGGGISLAFGNIGWVPLAPFEAFTPWWGRGGVAFNNAFVVNNYNDFTHHYRNALVRGGVTAVSHERFLQGRFDQHVAVTREALANVHVARAGLPVAPTAANLRFTAHASFAASAPRTTLFQRSFAGSGRVATRTPFAEQRATFSSGSRFAGSPAARPAATSAQRFTEQGATRASDPWTRFGAARGTAVGAQGNAYQRSTPSYARGAESNGYSQRATPSYSNGYQQRSTPSYSNGYQQRSTPSYSNGYQQRSTPSYSNGYQQRSTPSYSNGYQQRSTPSDSAARKRGYQQRSTPSYSRGGYNGGYQQRSAPSYQRSAPSYQRSAPSYQRSAPSYQRSAPSNQQRTTNQAPRSRAPQSSGDDRHHG